MKRVLIFTAGFGEGHNSAARNVHDALELIAEDECHVEVLDLFESCYGRINEFVKKTYLAAINSTPTLWKGFYNLMDKPSVMENNLIFLSKMRRAMSDLLREADPDVVVTVYPVYNYILDDIFAGEARPFSHVTVITDSMSVNSIWLRAYSDYFIVANEPTGQVLREANIPEEKIRVLGFPVQTIFASREGVEPLPDPSVEKRVIYIVNSGRKKAPKVVEKLLENKEIKLTVTVGRSAELHEEIERITRKDADRVQILGWTTQIPKLLMSNHIVISKAGGATTQEAIAAQCPMIVNQVVPGQEEGNYETLHAADAGELWEKPKEIADAVEAWFANDAKRWHHLKANIAKISHPDSSIKLAKFLLEEAVAKNAPPRKISTLNGGASGGAKRSVAAGKNLLLCDLHTHTTWSDGKLSVSELVDFYGQRGFDALCITDHIADHKTVIGKVANRTGLVLRYEDSAEYFACIEKEKKRAWKKYDMLLMTGLEFNKDGYTSKSSTHLLAVDLKQPIDPTQDLKQLISEIHSQEALAIASHPHEFKTNWGRNTLFLWENQEEYAPLIDAWEIANRDDIFNPVGLKRLPFIANSDFHKPKHIYSWKTVLFCEKERDAIKDCVRRNRDIAITLYRDHRFGYGYATEAERKSERELLFFPQRAASVAAG